MVSRALSFILALSLVSGCIHFGGKKKVSAPEINQIIAPYQQFTAKNFDWSTVQRIVLMPLANQSAYPRTSYELQANLSAELQRAGRFDVVVATRDDPGARAQDVFASGQFNEMEILRVAREYQADAVLFANVTQYHPYTPPKIGMSLLLVSPAEGIAIASSSGLWDAREASTSMLAHAYFKQTQAYPRSLLGNDRVVESPDVFQRFVCQQIAASMQPPVSGSGPTLISGGGPTPLSGSGAPNSAMMPVEGNMPAETMMPYNPGLPPVPPASMSVP